MLPCSSFPPRDPVKKPGVVSGAGDNCLQFPHQIYLRGGGGGGDGKGGGASAALLGIFAPLPGWQRTFLVSVVLFLQLLLILLARSISVSVFSEAPPLNFAAPGIDLWSVEELNFASSGADEGISPDSSAAACEDGRVYVYDLPPEFNGDLLAGCGELSPWGSRCDALSNGGFGPPAIDLVGSVPDELLPSWLATDQFAVEVIFHRRMLRSRCRTGDPSAASAFFIPFYGGLAVGKYLWSVSGANDRDRLSRMLLRWIREQPAWKRSRGWDHFLVLGRISWDFRRTGEHGWGSSFIHMPEMENMTRLLIERNPWDYFDAGVPYPTGFHPRSPADVRAWQTFALSRRRETLFCFAGGSRSRIKGDFRQVLLEHCARSPEGSCRTVNCTGLRCANRTAETLNLFLSSSFCLQPRGDSFTRRSIFDCMVAGAIPVFFWRRSAYTQYEWFLPGDAGDYSVFIDAGAVRNGTIDIATFLAAIGEDRVKRMREKVVELLPRLVYSLPAAGLGGGVDDAFDVALRGVLRQFKNHRKLWAPGGG